MKVLIVGSNHHMTASAERASHTSVEMSTDPREPTANPSGLVETFKSACTDIGKSLANEKVHLVVGSSAEHTADYWVMRGAASVEGRHKLTILRPEGRETPQPPSEGPGKFDVTYRQLRGPWTAGRVSQILAADCVLMIGGSRGTAQVGQAAIALERPVLSVPWFGGAGAELMPELRPFYDCLGTDHERLGNLAENWTAENASIVSTTLHKLVGRRAFARSRLSSDLLPLALNLILFAVWVWLFVNPPEPKQASFFALLAVSAFLGTSLRNSLRMVIDPTEPISRHALVAELSAGLVLAFLLSLLYLAGSITFRGDSEAAAQSLDSYQRIALTMAVLGVAGGWLLERVAQFLSQWLLDKVPPK